MRNKLGSDIRSDCAWWSQFVWQIGDDQVTTGRITQEFALPDQSMDWFSATYTEPKACRFTCIRHRDSTPRLNDLLLFEATAALMKRFMYKSVIMVATMSALATAGWFGRKHYQKIQESRCLEDAADSLAKKDFQNAALCLRQALQLNPRSIEAVTATAEMLEMEGAPGAVEWRIRAAQLQPGDTEARFNWAQTAIKARDARSAAEALAGVKGSARGTAQYHKLAGALAWSLDDSEDAEKHYLEALRLEPSNSVTAFNLDTVRLRSTNKATAEEARLSIEQQLLTNSPLRLTALRQLMSYEKINQSLPKALDYSKQVISDGAASYEDKLEHLDLLHQVGNPEFDSWLLQLKQEATNSPARAFVLGKRLEKMENPTNVLAWVQSLPEDLQSSPPLLQLTADCYVTLKDWNRLLEAIDGQNWADAEPSRLAMIAFARRALGQDPAARSAWHAALEEAAHRLDGLSLLARLTARWGWDAERAEVLRETSIHFPSENLAVIKNDPPNGSENGLR